MNFAAMLLSTPPIVIQKKLPTTNKAGQAVQQRVTGEYLTLIGNQQLSTTQIKSLRQEYTVNFIHLLLERKTHEQRART